MCLETPQPCLLSWDWNLERPFPKRFENRFANDGQSLAQSGSPSNPASVVCPTNLKHHHQPRYLAGSLNTVDCLTRVRKSHHVLRNPWSITVPRHSQHTLFDRDNCVRPNCPGQKCTVKRLFWTDFWAFVELLQPVIVIMTALRIKYRPLKKLLLSSLEPVHFIKSTYVSVYLLFGVFCHSEHVDR